MRTAGCRAGLVSCLIGIMAFSSDLPAVAAETPEKPVPPLRPLERGEDIAVLRFEGAVLIGRYVLEGETAKVLGTSAEFRKTFERIETNDWRAGRYTEQNARLTVAQRMDDYIRTARQSYDVRRPQPQARPDAPQRDVSIDEIGDRFLSNALLTVMMAEAWKVPLQDGQLDALNEVLRLGMASHLRREPLLEAKRLRKGRLSDLAQRDRFRSVSFEELTPAEQVFHTVWTLKGTVDAEGVETYLLSDSGNSAFAVVEALKAIDAPMNARLVEASFRLFGEGGPPRDRQARQDALENFTAEQREMLPRLTTSFRQSREDVHELLYAYVQRNVSSIEGAREAGIQP